MLLADNAGELEDDQSVAPPKTCRMGHLLSLLDDEDRDALERLLADDAKEGTRLARYINKQGPAYLELAGDHDDPERIIQIARLCTALQVGSLRRHRNGECTCARDGD